jgi:hypothetical protein
MGMLDLLAIAKVKSAANNHEKKKYDPEFYFQDSSQSIIGEDNRYDMRVFSQHEDKTIKEVISVVNSKYPERFRGFGLVNETYPITYKPRYVLFRIAELKYHNSDNPFDLLGCAFSFVEEGAMYRSQAIEFFERSYSLVPKWKISEFTSMYPFLLLSKFSDAYEKEHKYEEAINLLHELIRFDTGNTRYFKQKINELRTKQKNWKPLRRRKVSDAQLEFDQSITNSALKYLPLLK